MKNDNFYLTRFGFLPPQLDISIPSDLKIIVIIPCYVEENLIRTLESFQTNHDFSFSVEVITVINASENDSPENKKLNFDTFEKAKAWSQKNSKEKLNFHFILNNNLPKKHAGVGLARKIGMDEAVFRFHQIGFDGIIVCADADAIYTENFISEIHDHFFIHHPNSSGCSIYFEHPLSGIEHEQSIYDGIVRYELFLRFYKNALSYCGFPFSFHTIGSSMVARSSAYQKSGGMNKRQAGEDFYFLQKLIELGNFSELNSTKVIPSPRPSHRVPFGTGRAVSEWLSSDQKKWKVYSISTFDVLKKFNDQVENLYVSDSSNLLDIHPLLISFLEINKIDEKLKEIRLNSSSQELFLKRFYSWFDAFMVLKFAHFFRDNGMETQDVKMTSDELLKRLGINPATTMQDQLSIFRNLDRRQ